MSSDNLPIELWTHIAGLCRRQDLHSLSIVNATALYGVRPILFRNVILRPAWVKCNASIVQSLLHEDVAQLRAIIQVRLTSDVLTASRDTCEMMLNLLSRFINAHAMVLMGWPFYPEAGKKFLSLMCSGQWKSFSYPWEADNAAKFHLLNFDNKGWGAITGLTKITLGTASLLRGTRQFLRASASTITHFTLSKVLDHNDLTGLVSSGNVTINLPQLSYFECTTDSSLLKGIYISDTRSSTVTLFLRSHPTIQHLRLHCGNGYCYMDRHCTIDPALIDAEFLPNLKTLEAHVPALSVLVFRGVKSMQAIEEVITGDWTNADRPDHLSEARVHMDSCLSRIVDGGGFPDVKRFTMLVKKSSCSESSRITASQMGTIERILPSVDDWTGNGDGLEGASEEELIDMFKPFKQLRIVRFHSISSEVFRARIVICVPQAVATLESLYCEVVDSA